jgi:hypothetical protein
MLEREHAVCEGCGRVCGEAFFPLDEVLGLLPGQLTPGLQEKLVRLGSWLPFEPAAELFTAFTGASVSKAGCRRLTERAGAVQVAHQEAAVQAMEAGELVEPERVAEKLLLSADGAMVPLVGGEWAEVRTLAIGEVQVEEKEEGQPEIRTTPSPISLACQMLSPFSALR